MAAAMVQDDFRKTTLGVTRALVGAVSLLAAPAEHVYPLAAAGAGIDALDAASSAVELARGQISTYTFVSGGCGAMLFALLGLATMRGARPRQLSLTDRRECMMAGMDISAWTGPADYGPLFIPIVAAVGAAIHVSRVRDRPPGRAAEIVLLWFFGGVVGVGGLVVTASHVFFAAATAQQIGFPAGNPFQFEVAMANFAFAVLGLLCLRMRGGFWEATAIGFAVFYWGATLGHFVELLGHDNHAPYNAGPILITDIGVPLVILWALWRLRTAEAAASVD